MFQVHIQPMPGPILGHIDEQKPLLVVPSTGVGLLKVGDNSQVLKFFVSTFVIISYRFSR